jgi:S1-C subfamily serine protease
VSVLDAVIFAAALAAGIGGWRFGFIARLLAWAGVAVGLMIGIQFVPGVVTAFGGAAADDRVTVALLFLVLVAVLGQGVGLALGALVHRLHPEVRGLPVWDRAAGAAIGVLGVLTLLWMTIPSLATAEGWPARAARGSSIVRWVQDFAPKQPAQFAAWGRRISDAPYPSVLGPLDTPHDPGVPPQAGLSIRMNARVKQSIVKVSGTACDEIQLGSGWVIASGVVVTNAHVVAGESDTHVDDARGGTYAARVVAFDPNRDVAILSVPSLKAPALSLAQGHVNETGAVYGHPQGLGLSASPARVAERITAIGTDIYRGGHVRRDVYVLAAALQPGDSGAPLVDATGHVIGVAFAIDFARGHTAYAITNQEVSPVYAARTNHAVDTGPCLRG